MYDKYPVGLPVIITSDFQHISSYFGLAKVKVLPNKSLFHPVLPYTSNGKLDDCKCTDKDRAIVGTWCTPELELACSNGYEIPKIYEVYHI